VDQYPKSLSGPIGRKVGFSKTAKSRPVHLQMRSGETRRVSRRFNRERESEPRNFIKTPMHLSGRQPYSKLRGRARKMKVQMTHSGRRIGWPARSTVRRGLQGICGWLLKRRGRIGGRSLYNQLAPWSLKTRNLQSEISSIVDRGRHRRTQHWIIETPTSLPPLFRYKTADPHPNVGVRQSGGKFARAVQKLRNR